MLRLVVIATAALCVFFSAGVAAAARNERIQSIEIAEQTARKLMKLAEAAEDSAREVADRVLNNSRHLAGNPSQQQRVFRKFQAGSIRLQRLNFRVQRQIQKAESKALRAFDVLEPNPEASQIVNDAFSQATQRLQAAIQLQTSRLQSIFSPPAMDIPPDEPNGL